MDFENIVLDRKGKVARITINRPKVLNALNSKTMDELERAIESIEKNSDIHVVTVTGVGEKAFVAGADISEIELLDGPNGKAFSQRGQSIFNRLADLDKPVIAAVNGYALGGGCELALACHIRIASENANFGLPEVKLGVIPGYGGTQRLSRLIGLSMSTELILTGTIINAQESLRIGLVNKVVPPDQLSSSLEELVQSILSRGPIAVRRALYAITYGLQNDFSTGLEIEASLFGDVCNTEDKKEGTKAFLEKRPPTFKNK
jgi:enoyl-CoA hydratase